MISPDDYREIVVDTWCASQVLKLKLISLNLNLDLNLNLNLNLNLLCQSGAYNKSYP